MRIVIVTGMSGAGKTTVLKIFEDAGWHCVDNLPPTFISSFAELCIKRDTGITQAALGIDIRGGKMFADFSAALPGLDRLGVPYTILFLDAANDVLLKRYKETRRNHPLSANDRIIDGIQRERQMLEEIRSRADYIIETSYFLPRDLKEKINLLFLENKNFNSLTVTLLSFGFKYGIPHDSDLLFDVRFLPNPFYIPEMKFLTGNDTLVKDFVLTNPITIEFLNKTIDLLEFLMPKYISEGKSQLIISIGCTGGKHRSVATANYISAHLREAGYYANANHRDITRH